jgi:glycosyltransferase involved in cell wall biosynthesis
VTFHREGRLAHVSLNSIERTLNRANKAKLNVETILVLDNADAETRRAVIEHPFRRAHDQVIEVSHGDLASSRNEAISLSRGACVAILDGDDLYSANWLELAHAAHQAEDGRHIYHPEITVSFDAIQNYNFTVDQRSSQFDAKNLLMTNYWCSCTFASRQVFLDHPYVPKDGPDCGFGFEDWHWNCETVASGLEHWIVPGSALFYRRKRAGSLGTKDKQAFRIIHPTRLFSFYRNE